ncbi:MAG: hypothetical protein ACJAZF_004921 [Granulosicoccus sp.]|jgi:hypothetical protein
MNLEYHCLHLSVYVGIGEFSTNRLLHRIHNLGKDFWRTLFYL